MHIKLYSVHIDACSYIVSDHTVCCNMAYFFLVGMSVVGLLEKKKNSIPGRKLVSTPEYSILNLAYPNEASHSTKKIMLGTIPFCFRYRVSTAYVVPYIIYCERDLILLGTCTVHLHCQRHHTVQSTHFKGRVATKAVR